MRTTANTNEHMDHSRCDAGANIEITRRVPKVRQEQLKLSNLGELANVIHTPGIEGANLTECRAVSIIEANE